MTFEQLFYFVETYRQKSISLAADNLYISRQALSLTIRKLEQEFHVSLFNRSVNGITPTEAGNELYRAAQIILQEQAILNQNMLYLSNQATGKEQLNMCKVGIAESMIPIYGEQLLNILSDTFKHTYFSLSSITRKNNQDYYKDFDISIACIPKQEESYYTNLGENISCKTLTEYPLFAWVSNSSNLTTYNTAITLDMLHNMSFSVLKTYYNSTDFLDYVGHNQATVVELKKNFVDYIEQFNYYTLDLPLNHGSLTYQDLFINRNVSAIQTSNSFVVKIIYNTSTCSDFYPLIASVLLDSKLFE